MEDQNTLLERIKTVKHFRSLKPADLFAIVTAGRVRTYKAGEVIYTQGDPCAGMFVLITGRVHLTKLGPQGQVNIMAVIDPVIMFNEVAVLDGGPNPLTGMAVQDCLTWTVGYDAFQVLIERIPQVGISLLRVLARRNREMIAQYENLSFRNVLARCAKLLFELSDGGNRSIDRSSCPIEEMANHIASVPEAISRSLKTMKEMGIIDTNRAEIKILDRGRLEQLKNGD